MKRVGSTAFSACLRAHAYVDGDSTLRRSIISKKDPSEKSKDALETSRRKEARRAATCARSMWVLLHFLLIYVCATHGTEFQKALKEGWLGYLMTLFGLLGLNVLLYLATSMRDPGFQEMRDVGLCAGEGDRPSNSHCAVAGSDTLEGRSTDWLRSSEPSSTPTSPSGEASTSLAAASLAGIRPPHSPTAEEAAALALTTNSNHIGNGNGTATSRPRLRSGCTAPATVTPGAQADETYVAIDLPPSSATDTPHGRTCPYCQAWQPLRTKHCHDCDRCVRRFDHHCVWVGNCIGSRNYRLFYAYLLTQLSCLVWGLRILLSGFRPIRSYYTRAFRLPGRSHSPVDTWVTDHLPHIGGILLLGTLIIFVGSLILFHTYLIATDQTNYEMLQLAGGGVYYLRDVPEGIAPFSRGPAANCKNFLCQGERWGEVHAMPPVEEMRFSAAQGTIWSNKHYSCFD